MFKKFLRRIVTGLLLAALGIFMLGGLVAAVIRKGYESSEAAGWAQAIGAVVAIAFAIWTAKGQANELRAREIGARIEAANGLYVSAEIAIGYIEDAIEHAETQGLHGVSSFRSETLRDMRSAIDGYVRCPDQMACICALNLSLNLRETENAFRAHPGGYTDLSDYFVDQMIAQRDLAKATLLDLGVHISKLRDEQRKHGLSLS